MPIGDYCQRDVTATQPKASLREAARQMHESGVGSLPVVWLEKLTGIVTDRDLALAALCGSGDPDALMVGDVVVGYPPVCVHETSPLSVAAGMMRRHSVRRLPVVDADDRLVGILTSDDMLRLLAGELGGLACAAATQAPGRAGAPAPSADDLLFEGEA